MVKILPKPFAFEWDKWNKDKNFKKHKVTNIETEEIFGNRPLKIFDDIRHSLLEKRFIAHGITNKERKLTIIFTIRTNRIRIISARDMNKKEVLKYEKIETNS